MKKVILISLGVILTMNIYLFSTVKSDKSTNSMFSLLTKASAQGNEVPEVTVCGARLLTSVYDPSCKCNVTVCKGYTVPCGKTKSNC